jgi:hypothetical protein
MADAEPNPVRTLESHAIQLNIDGCANLGVEHYMVSRKLGTERLVRFVEQCRKCGWVDESSLDWWAEDSIKSALSKRAQRIAVAAESEPFSFAQSSHTDLDLDDLLAQALAAASMCWSREDLMNNGVFKDQRAKEIMTALRAEIMRMQSLAEAKALSVARKRLLDEVMVSDWSEVDKQEVLAAIR